MPTVRSGYQSLLARVAADRAKISGTMAGPHQQVPPDYCVDAAQDYLEFAQAKRLRAWHRISLKSLPTLNRIAPQSGSARFFMVSR
jgi:hypothetical protein